MDRAAVLFLKFIGAALMVIGVVGAYYGPLEIYVFYLFSQGGPFYYDGFGMGSLWFGVLAAMNLGYYLVAAVCLPVGIGHLRLRRWGLTLTRLYLWFWLGGGLLLLICGTFLLPAAFRLEISREILVTRLGIVGTVGLATLVMAPAAALRIYGSRRITQAFEAHDARRYWTEATPLPVLAVLLLELLLILALHLAIFFQGIFPLFGRISIGRPSIPLITACILALGTLMVGTAWRKAWAWWGSLIFFSLMAVSTLLTFSGYRLYDLLTMMKLPAAEAKALNQLSLLHGFPVVVPLALPILAGLGLVAVSRRYFNG